MCMCVFVTPAVSIVVVSIVLIVAIVVVLVAFFVLLKSLIALRFCPA